jgi:hypothetical protein
MYPLLFGKAFLEVMPDVELGMKFSAKYAYKGYKLRFGMQDSDMLVIATQKRRMFSLLPRRLFRGKFPSAFVEERIHWYDHVDGEVEFRPRNDPWSTSSDNWRLKRNGPFWHLTKSGIALVNVSSNTVTALLKVLSPLESRLHIHALWDKTSKSLDIELPRLQLDFHLENHGSEIHSRQYRGMYVDPHQELGTLAGFSSKLILKETNGERLVLIPEGSVTYSKTVDHVNVCVGEGTVIKMHAYRIDVTLGRLVDNGNIQSKLYLCYLHAVTSYCLPDPLTGHTGTESAISILRSGAVRSFDVLSKQSILTMELIARLAPKRSYYPQNLKVMQQIEWDHDLPFLSQNSILYTSIMKLFDQARTGSFFYSQEFYSEPPVLKLSEPHLLERDLIRSSVFCVSDFGAENFSLQWDRQYQSRDRGQNSERSGRAYIAATLILRDQAALHDSTPSKQFRSLRQSYFEQGTVHGPNYALPHLGYDALWLKEPSSYLPALWCGLHSTLASHACSITKFDIAIWLSTVAFSEAADMSIVEALAAFYRMPDFKSVAAPQKTQFLLSEGDVFKSTQIRKIARNACKPFHACADVDIPRLHRESDREYRQRKKYQFEGNQGDAVEKFTRELENQWPCEIPRTPTNQTTAAYIEVSKAMALVSKTFKVWHDNLCFYRYLKHVSTTFAQQVASRVIPPCFSGPPAERSRKAVGVVRFLSAEDIFHCPAPHLSSDPPERPSIPLQESIENSIDVKIMSRINSLCHDLRLQAHSKFEKQYVEQLEESFSALRETFPRPSTVCLTRSIVESLQVYLKDCKNYLQELDSVLRDATVGRVQRTHRSIAGYIQNCPRVCTIFWLRRLNQELWTKLSDEWRAIIIRYGLAITELQRANRLLSLSNSPNEFADEFLNIGHQNWNPSLYPESLLLEAESGIMIREVQEDIARHMRSPPNAQNSMMQLNMGEGKSTVIVPAVAVYLANGFRYVNTTTHCPLLRSHSISGSR